MKLARKAHTAGSKIRYEIDYSNWLETGDTLSSTPGDVTVELATADVTDVTVSGLEVESDHLYFFVEGGSEAEVFTVEVLVTTSRGEIDTDTVEFFVVAA